MAQNGRLKNKKLNECQKWNVRNFFNINFFLINARALKTTTIYRAKSNHLAT